MEQPGLGFLLGIPSVLYAIISRDDQEQFGCDVRHIVSL